MFCVHVFQTQNQLLSGHIELPIIIICSLVENRTAIDKVIRSFLPRVD